MFKIFTRREVEIGRRTARLWDLYDILGALALVQIDDFTDDVDSPEEYEYFYEKLKSAAMADDA